MGAKSVGLQWDGRRQERWAGAETAAEGWAHGTVQNLTAAGWEQKQSQDERQLASALFFFFFKQKTAYDLWL